MAAGIPSGLAGRPPRRLRGARRAGARRAGAGARLSGGRQRTPAARRGSCEEAARVLRPPGAHTRSPSRLLMVVSRAARTHRSNLPEEVETGTGVARTAARRAQPSGAAPPAIQTPQPTPLCPLPLASPEASAVS